MKITFEQESLPFCSYVGRTGSQTLPCSDRGEVEQQPTASRFALSAAIRPSYSLVPAGHSRIEKGSFVAEGRVWGDVEPLVSHAARLGVPVLSCFGVPVPLGMPRLRS